MVSQTHTLPRSQAAKNSTRAPLRAGRMRTHDRGPAPRRPVIIDMSIDVLLHQPSYSECQR